MKNDSMHSDDGVLETARAIRPYLDDLDRAGARAACGVRAAY
jgi:hypothetical protein